MVPPVNTGRLAGGSKTKGIQVITFAICLTVLFVLNGFAVWHLKRAEKCTAWEDAE